MQKEISGNFEKALSQLITNLKAGNKSTTQMLYQWDDMRGTDWFTSTKTKEILTK